MDKKDRASAQYREMQTRKKLGRIMFETDEGIFNMFEEIGPDEWEVTEAYKKASKENKLKSANWYFKQ